MISVSVVIPTYNGGAFIGDALRSVFEQTLPPREVIVVDDASTDDTSDVVAAAARTAPVPVHLIRLGKNSGGPAHPLNVGIGAASGEFIAVLDQDDMFVPEKLERQVTVLESHPDLAFVFSFCRLHDEPDQVALEAQLVKELLRHVLEERDYSRMEGPVALRLLIDWGNYAWGYPGFVFRRSDWRRKGGLDAGLKIASDLDLLCWLCTQGAVGLLPVVHYIRRQHGSNLTSRRAAMELEIALVLCRYLSQQRWLIEDRAHCHLRRDWTLMQARMSVREGRYRDALVYYRLALGTWGWGAGNVWQIARYLPWPPVRRALKACGLYRR